MSNDKQSLREEVWNLLEESGDTLFPGPEGRIPNFKGREEAARRLRQHDLYQSADTLKVNPDSPQQPVRRMALADGKTIYMAVPKLKQEKCFIELNPATLSGEPSDWSTIKGASRHGNPVHPDAMPEIDVIVTGIVATDSEGRRLGKGGGYSDLEFAILLEFGLINRSIPIVSTLHPCQELDSDRIPFQDQDISLSAYFLPDRTVEVASPLRRPTGFREDLIQTEKFDEIPVLDNLATDR